MQIIEEEMDKQISDYAATLPLSQAKDIYTAYKNKELNIPFQRPDENKTERVMLGAAQRFGQSLEVIPEGIGIIGGQVGIYLGNIFKTIPLDLSQTLGDEFVRSGEIFIDAANSDLQAKRKLQEQRLMPLSQEDIDSPLYKSTATGLDYTTQIALAFLLGGTGALTAMGVRMQAETAVEGLEKYKEKNPEDKDLNGYKEFNNISKELLLSSAKTAVNLYVERALGVPKQFSQFKKAIKTPSVGIVGMGKSAAKGFAMGYGEEWATETIQGVTDTTFDAFLGRMKDLPELMEAYNQSINDAVYAGIFGGGFGASGHVIARGKAIGQVKEAMANVVPEEDLERVATAIVDSHIAETKTLIATQLALSTQLRDKHGAIFNAMNVAAKNAMMDSGVVNTMSEDEIAQYSTELATKFADQVLAEANKRNVPIMDVIKDKDIVYDPVKKELRLAPKKYIPQVNKQLKKRPMSLLAFLIKNGGIKDEHGELKVLDAQKGRPGLVNNKYGLTLDRARELAEEAGYFGIQAKNNLGQTSISDLLDLIGKELRGEKVFTEQDAAEQIRNKEEEFDQDEAEYYYEQFLDEQGVDYSNMSFKEKKDAYNKLQPEQELDVKSEVSMDESGNLLDAEGNILFQESMDLAEEMANIDANNDEYTGETINIDGVEKPVYNSNGDRIAKSEEALRAFYKWFGDSKVVDEQGRPLVVYHGTNAEFDTFDISKAGNATNAKNTTLGFFFTPHEDYAKTIGNKIMPVYLKALNMFEVGFAKNGEDYLTGNKKERLNVSHFSKDYKFVDGLESIKEAVIKKYGEYNKENVAKWSKLIKDMGYDGIKVITGDTPTFESDFIPTAQYVVFEPNQIKSTSNRGTYSLTDNNIYYQEKEEPTVYATHNMNLIGLRNALKVGGLAMPSFAVRGVESGNINQFGDIVLVGNKDISSPGRSVEVFDRDAWTPSLGYAMRYSLTTKATDYIKDVLEKVGKGREYSVYRYNIEENIMSPTSNSLAQDLYMYSQGKEPVNYVIRDDAYLEWYDENIMSNAEPYLWTENATNTDMIQAKFSLNNMMKILRKQERSGGGMIGDYPDATKLAQYFAYKFKNIKDLKKNLVNIKGQEERSKFFSDIQKSFTELSNSLKKEGEEYEFYDPERWFAYAVLSETKEETKKTLEKGNLQSDEKALAKVEEFRKKLERIPTDYFEAKPRRAVMLNEFSGIIMPNEKQYDKVAKEVGDRYNIPVIRVERGNEEQYKNALNEIESKRPGTLFQGKTTQKGLFDANSKVIKLFENADASTLEHELAHYWLDNMWTYATSGAASEAYKTQFQAVKDFLNVKPEQKWLTAQQHEKFASAYEKYIHRGIIPNSIMGNVFDNYERFIRKVYNSIDDIRAQGKKSFKLTPEIIKFFDSMLTGGIDTGAIEGSMAVEARNEEAQKADDTTMREAKSVVEEMPEREVMPEVKPVQVKSETKESRLFNRLKGLAGAEGAVEYNVAHIEEQRELARKMWKENPQKANAILKGTETADDVLRQALYTEQQRLALENGDTNTFLNSLRKQTAEATRMGQELSALRGVAEDITDPAYWIRSAETEALKNLAKKQTKNLENAVGNSPLMELTSRLDKDIKALQKEVMGKETDAEKMKALKEGVKTLAEKYQGLDQPDTVFYQVDWDNEDFANDYIENKVKEKLGIALPKETAKAFIQTARELDTLSKQRDEFGNPVEAFFVKKDELERMRNSHTPTSRTKILISTIGRGNMLTAPSTSVLNAVSNTQNYFVENVVRRVANILEGKTNDNIVDEELIKKYRGMAWKTFWDTGYDMSFMTSLLDERLYKGESVSHSEGEGWIRGLGRWTEKYVFSRLISSPDIYFKSVLGFSNYVGNEATNIAYQEGLSGEKAKKRANELFMDAIKIEPETEQGKQIRLKAQTDALILTFQQDTKFAEMLLKVRDAINKGTGDIGIGDILSPFIKTPANILSMSFDAAVGPFASPVNLIGALNDIKNKNYKSARVMQMAKQTTTAALAYVVIGLLAAMLIDDDDYIPDYAQLTAKERAVVRARGGSFGSIKVGGKYISTDFFGTFEMPLVTFLNARRTGNILKGIAGGVGAKFIDAPVLKDVLGSSDAIKEMATSKDDIVSAIGENVANAAISRLTPNALNAVAKIIDDKDRKINGITDKIISRIPFVRETLDEKLNATTGMPQELGRLNTLLLGSRGHDEETNALAVEIGRLMSAGEVVNITDPTKHGDLSKLSESEKLKIQDIFAREFAKKAGSLVKTASYSRKTDEGKKEAIDGVRKSVIDNIRRKYRKEIKNQKKRVVRK